MNRNMYETGDGFRLLIETTPAQVGSETPSRTWGESRSGVERVVRQAGDKALGAAFATIRQIADAAADLLAELNQKSDGAAPRQLEITFGVSFNGNLEAFIAKTSAEATLSVKLSWETDRAQPQ